MEFYEEDEDHRIWLDMIDRQGFNACSDCAYSLNESMDSDATLICYNKQASHTNSYWNRCDDTRSIYGMCGPDAIYFTLKDR